MREAGQCVPLLHKQNATDDEDEDDDKSSDEESGSEECDDSEDSEAEFWEPAPGKNLIEQMLHVES